MKWKFGEVCGIFKRNLAVEPETLELNTGHVSH